MRSRISSAYIVSMLLLAACTDREPPGGPSLGRQGLNLQAGAFSGVPAVPVELPPRPRPWDTDDQALVDAVAAGDNHESRWSKVWEG